MESQIEKETNKNVHCVDLFRSLLSISAISLQPLTSIIIFMGILIITKGNSSPASNCQTPMAKKGTIQ